MSLEEETGQGDEQNRSGTAVDFNRPHSHEKEVPAIPQTSLVSLLLLPPCLTGQPTHRGQLQGESATRLCDSPGARPGEGSMGVSVQTPASSISNWRPSFDPLPSAVSQTTATTTHHTFQLPTSPLPGGDGDQTIEIQYPSVFLPSSYPAATSSLTVQRAILGNCRHDMVDSRVTRTTVAWRGCLALFPSWVSGFVRPLMETCGADGDGGAGPVCLGSCFCRRANGGKPRFCRSVVDLFCHSQRRSVTFLYLSCCLLTGRKGPEPFVLHAHMATLRLVQTRYKHSLGMII